MRTIDIKPLHHRRRIENIVIKLTHNNIRKLIKIYKEECKGKQHDEYTHRFTYIKKMRKHPNCRGYRVWQTPNNYINIMMNRCRFRSSAGCLASSNKYIKHITKNDERLIRYVIKHFSSEYFDDLPF